MPTARDPARRGNLTNPDPNPLLNPTPGTAAATAADKQAQKDCVPLGLG